AANSRQSTLKVLDRPALVSLYTACSDSSFRLGAVFSRIKLSVDGEHSTQRDRLKYSRVVEGRRVFVTVTARLTGALTSVTAAAGAGGEHSAGQFEAAAPWGRWSTPPGAESPGGRGGRGWRRGGAPR